MALDTQPLTVQQLIETLQNEMIDPNMPVYLFKKDMIPVCSAAIIGPLEDVPGSVSVDTLTLLPY